MENNQTKINKLKLLGIGLIAAVLIGSFGVSKWFQANLVDSGASNSANSDLYISNAYTALEADTDFIQIKTANGLNNIAALSFTLKYNPNYIHISDQITLGNITDATGNPVQPTMTIVTPNNETGEVLIDIANAESFSVAANESILSLPITLQNTASIGTVINVQFSESQIIDANYNIKSAKTANGVITVQAASVGGLKTLSATAIDANTIEVIFDDYLTAINQVNAKLTDDLSVQSYDNITSIVTFTGIQISANDGKKIILTTLEALTQGTSYKLIFGQGPVGNLNKQMDPNHNLTYFSFSTTSTNSLLSVTSTEKRELVATFATAPDATLANNPTKYQLFDASGNTLFVQTAVAAGTKVTLTTQQVLNTEAKYYLLTKKVIPNTQNNVAYFFIDEAKTVQILSFNPEIISLTGGITTITGENLDLVNSVTMNGTTLTFSAATGQLTIPAQTNAKLVDIQFNLKNGEIITKQNALTIQQTEGLGINILNEESYASPTRIPNDGVTESTLWVALDATTGIVQVNKVSLDLRIIGGTNPIAEMVDVDENGQAMIVDGKRWYYLKVTVPNTVKTQEEAYLIRVTAEDTQGNKAYGTVSIIVSNNTRSSAMPEILKSYAVPQQVRKDDNLGFYAYVQDLDGISDIDMVTADLSSIGLGPKEMIAAGSITKTNTTIANTTSNNTTIPDQNTSLADLVSSQASLLNTSNSTEERSAEWFGIENLTISSTTKAGTYTIPVTATDISGESMTQELTLIVTNGNAPEFDADRTGITPQREIPHDGQTTFSVKTYITDEDGINDVTTVSLDLHEIGGTSIEMDLQGDLKDGQKGAWFIAENLTVAPEVRKGIAQLYMYAQDTQGNITKAEFDELELKVTDQDETGTAPEIDSARSYTTPPAMDAGSKDMIFFNAFIRKHDFEIVQVMADLGNIAKYIGTPTASSADAANSCFGATERMVCMTPGIKEGTRGQWYTLKDVVLLDTTEASTEPYRIKIIVTDSKGKVGEGYIALNVGDGTIPTYQIGFPKVQMAISTSPEEIEVVFTNPINPKGATPNAFRITETAKTSNTLAVRKVVMNASATIATITTTEQTEGVYYTLFANATELGLKEDKYTDNHKEFYGFDKRDIPPQVAKVTAVKDTMIEVVFSEGIKPTTVVARDFEIFSHDEAQTRLEVYNVEFVDDNQTVRVSTEKQISEKKYMIRIKSLESASGIRVLPTKPAGVSGKSEITEQISYRGLHKVFTGFKSIPKTQTTIMESGDFDGNGKIDFTDFTIFSSIYGQTLINPEAVVIPEAATQQQTPTTQAPVTKAPVSVPVPKAPAAIPTTTPVAAPAPTSTNVFDIEPVE